MTTKTMPFPGDPRQPVLSCSHRQPPRPSLVCSTSISRRRRLPWMRHYPTNFPEARSRYRCVTRVNSPVTEPSYFPKVRWRGSSSHAPPRASSLGLRMARTFLAPLVHLGHLRPERGKSDAFLFGPHPPPRPGSQSSSQGHFWTAQPRKESPRR